MSKVKTSLLRRHLFRRMGALLLFLFLTTVAFAHTTELRAVLNPDGSATFYARTYHGMDELPSGGFIVDGVTYPFQGVIAYSTIPGNSIQISTCGRSQSASDMAQWVTVPNFNSCVAHTFSCTSNAPEAPLCNLTNTMMLGGPSISLQTATAQGGGCQGAATSLLVNASGNNITYQWQLDQGSGFADMMDNGTYTNVHTNTLNISQVTAAMKGLVFRCKVGGTDNCNNVSYVYSNALTFDPPVPAAITGQIDGAQVCNATATILSIQASGSSLAFQWMESTDGGNTFNAIPGANATALNLANLTDADNGRLFTVQVSNSCNQVSSNVVSLLVKKQISVSSAPVAATTCAGTTVSFGVTATGSDLAYQWQVSTDGGSIYTNLQGANAATLQLGAPIASLNGSQYRVRITGGCGPEYTSGAALLTVDVAPAITAQPAAVNQCEGGNAGFTISATGTSITYQWQLSTDNGATWTAVAGQTKATLNLTAVAFSANNNQYRCVVSGSCAPAATTDAAVLTVKSKATVTAHPQAVRSCAGTSATFTGAASGTALSYQWQVSTNGGVNWNAISGATGTTLTVNNITAAMQGNAYRLQVTGACNVAVSEPAQLQVTTAPAITSQPVSTLVCPGGEARFTVTATGSDLTYQWQLRSGSNQAWSNIAGATNAVLNVSNASLEVANYQYRVVISGACAPAVTSDAATLTLAQASAAFNINNPLQCVSANRFVLSNTSASNTGRMNYEWNFGDGDFTTEPNAVHRYAATGTYTVRLVVTSQQCPAVTDTVRKQVTVDAPVAGTRLETLNAIANQPIQLNARTMNAQYSWSPAEGLSSTSIANPTARISSEKRYLVKMTFASGCITTDTLLVRVFGKPDVFVPSAFTPDGDGRNDLLKVIPVQARQLVNFRVFNRWNNLLFATNNFNAGWDGNWNGQKQPNETYFWTCTYVDNNGKTVSNSGQTTLIR